MNFTELPCQKGLQEMQMILCSAMEVETIFVDLNNRDELGWVRVNTIGSLESIKNNNIELIEGKVLIAW